MGYFPNGSAGEYYENKYCSRCIHYKDKPACAVWELHLFRNYDACNDESSPLHVLIPISKDCCHNLQCRMFKPAEVMARRPVRQREKAMGELI